MEPAEVVNVMLEGVTATAGAANYLSGDAFHPTMMACLLTWVNSRPAVGFS